jgi:hypothetical protein
VTSPSLVPVPCVHRVALLPGYTDPVKLTVRFAGVMRPPNAPLCVELYAALQVKIGSLGPEHVYAVVLGDDGEYDPEKSPVFPGFSEATRTASRAPVSTAIWS